MLELKTHEEEEEERQRVNLFRVLYDEEQHMLGSEAREVPALQRGLAPFRAEQEAEATRPEEDEILHRGDNEGNQIAGREESHQEADSARCGILWT